MKYGGQGIGDVKKKVMGVEFDFGREARGDDRGFEGRNGSLIRRDDDAVDGVMSSRARLFVLWWSSLRDCCIRVVFQSGRFTCTARVVFYSSSRFGC